MNVLNIPTGLEILRMKGGASPDLTKQFGALREFEVAMKLAKQNLERQKELKVKTEKLVKIIE